MRIEVYLKTILGMFDTSIVVIIVRVHLKILSDRKLKQKTIKIKQNHLQCAQWKQSILKGNWIRKPAKCFGWHSHRLKASSKCRSEILINQNNLHEFHRPVRLMKGNFVIKKVLLHYKISIQSIASWKNRKRKYLFLYFKKQLNIVFCYDTWWLVMHRFRDCGYYELKISK